MFNVNKNYNQIIAFFIIHMGLIKINANMSWSSLFAIWQQLNNIYKKSDYLVKIQICSKHTLLWIFYILHLGFEIVMLASSTNGNQILSCTFLEVCCGAFLNNVPLIW